MFTEGSLFIYGTLAFIFIATYLGRSRGLRLLKKMIAGIPREPEDYYIHIVNKYKYGELHEEDFNYVYDKYIEYMKDRYFNAASAPSDSRNDTYLYKIAKVNSTDYFTAITLLDFIQLYYEKHYHELYNYEDGKRIKNDACRSFDSMYSCMAYICMQIPNVMKYTYCDEPMYKNIKESMHSNELYPKEI